MNVADSEVVLARLAESGYTMVDKAEEAGLVLYNTCSVRDNAEAKIRGRLGALQKIKRERKAQGTDLTVGVMGCMAQREKEDLANKHPIVDLVVGTDQFVHLPELLARQQEEGTIVATEFGDFETVNWSAHHNEGITAYVPVMRGCNCNCTYCIVPKTRGREKSRDPAMIEREVRQAVSEGYSQVTLLGQTVDAYGKTLGDGSNLATLLRRLHAIDDLKRIRFITSHPKDITDELLETMAELPRVAKHLHVPAQSGSSRLRPWAAVTHVNNTSSLPNGPVASSLMSNSHRYDRWLPARNRGRFPSDTQLDGRSQFDGAYVLCTHLGQTPAPTGWKMTCPKRSNEPAVMTSGCSCSSKRRATHPSMAASLNFGRGPSKKNSRPPVRPLNWQPEHHL